jgi:rare lipoprotein A
VTVRVNDRGPYVYGRELDLSQAAAEAIGLTYAGVDVIDATVLGYGPS